MVWSEILGALRRRWYVALVGVLLTAVLGVGAAALAPPVYTSRGLVMLFPSDTAVGANGNPFLEMSGLELPAQVLVSYYSSDPEQKRIMSVAPDAEVTVSMEDSTRGPVVAIDVTARSARSAISTLNYVAGSIPGTLDELQSEVGAKKKVRLQARPLTLDHEATADDSRSMRMTIVAAVVGLGASAAAACAIDGIALRRRGGPAKGRVGAKEPADGGAQRGRTSHRTARTDERGHVVGDPAAEPRRREAGGRYGEPGPRSLTGTDGLSYHDPAARRRGDGVRPMRG